MPSIIVSPDDPQQAREARGRPEPTRPHRDLGARIRAARIRRGFSVGDVAFALDVSCGCIESWENGRHRPNEVRLAMLCRKLWIDPALLSRGGSAFDEAVASMERPAKVRRAARAVRSQPRSPAPLPSPSADIAAAASRPPRPCEDGRGCPVTLGWCRLCGKDVDNWDLHAARRSAKGKPR